MTSTVRVERFVARRRRQLSMRRPVRVLRLRCPTQRNVGLTAVGGRLTRLPCRAGPRGLLGDLHSLRPSVRTFTRRHGLTDRRGVSGPVEVLVRSTPTRCPTRLTPRRSPGYAWVSPTPPRSSRLGKVRLSGRLKR